MKPSFIGLQLVEILRPGVFAGVGLTPALVGLCTTQSARGGYRMLGRLYTSFVGGCIDAAPNFETSIMCELFSVVGVFANFSIFVR